MSRQRLLLPLAAVTCLLLPAFAFADDAPRDTRECESDRDCPADYVCMMACPDIACEPDDEDCDASCVGTCEPDHWEGDGTCADDSDCAAGSYCLTFEYEVCHDRAPGCEPGTECRDEDDGGHGDGCRTHTDSACVPDWFRPCENDDECEDGLDCSAFEETHCEPTSPPCPEPDEEHCGDADREPSCETVTTEAYCLPAYLAPCEVDADCGDGFECVLEEWCWCDGAEPPGDDGDEADPHCGCETGDTGWCAVIPAPCDEDADCDDGWTCASSGDAVEPTCPVTPDGETDCDDPARPEDDGADGICAPPYWDEAFFGGGSGDGREDGEPIAEGGDADEDQPPRSPSRAPFGGCETGGGGPSLPALGLLLLLGLANFVRRSRLATSYVRRS